MKTIVNYAQKVKEQHALNKTLAPVETDLTDASRSYAIGEQFINDGDLFKAKTAIAQHDALVLDTNYEAADDITTQIKNKTVTTDPVPAEGSTNPVQSNGVFVENRNIYEVMGALGAKNYLQILASGTTTTNGVTFVVNDDGTITVSTDVNGATADTNYYLNPASQTWVDPDYPIGNYILSGCPAGGSAGTYRLALSRQGASSVLDTGTGATFTHASGVKVLALIQIGTGTVLTTPIVFKPMIRLATDTDDTFQPYAKTNQQLTAENEALTNKLNNEIVTRSALGAKNILPFDLAEIKALNTNGTWAGNVYTYRGVAFTVNSDGTISATGTATGGNASIKLFAASSNYEMLGKEVILTGCPSNGSASTYRIQAYRMASADGSTGTYFDDGAGTDAFTVLNDASGTVGSFAVAVYENATVTNLLFKPMVRLASDPDATYQPYAKTNRELTAENQTLTNQVSSLNTAITNEAAMIAPTETDLTDASQSYAIGKQFIYDGILYKAKTAIAQHDALVLNINYEIADNITTQIIDNNENIKEISNDVAWYGTSSTAASTQQKDATTTDGKFSLVAGAKIFVKFTNGNTNASPTLKVDSETAKNIKAYGTTTPTVWWKSGDVVGFVYDGTNFIMLPSMGEIQDLTTVVNATITGQNGFTIGSDKYLWYNPITKVGQLHMVFDVPSSISEGWHDIATIDKTFARNSNEMAVNLDSPPSFRDFMVSGNSNRISAYIFATDAGKTYRVGQSMVLVNP